MRLPEQLEDLNAVILSISDFTNRKQAELSLQEREQFWSDVVRTVPDYLCVLDAVTRRIIYSNHNLGLALGYEAAELDDMGELFWETLLHTQLHWLTLPIAFIVLVAVGSCPI